LSGVARPPGNGPLGLRRSITVEGTDAEKLEAFRRTLQQIRRRLDLLVNLPLEKLKAAKLQESARDLSKEA